MIFLDLYCALAGADRSRLCKHYEEHLAEVKRLREAAKTPLELEVVAALEKSIERSHITVRMLINALTEAAKASQAT